MATWTIWIPPTLNSHAFRIPAEAATIAKAHWFAQYAGKYFFRKQRHMQFSDEPARPNAWQSGCAVSIRYPDETAHLVWEESTLSLAKAFGVSDKAISNAACALDFQIAPGLLALIELGETHERALLRLGWKKDQIEALDKKLDR